MGGMLTETTSARLLKTVGPKLVPFCKTTAIYFVVFIPDESPSLLGLLLKCLPILSLMLFVALNGVGFGHKRHEHTYSRKIFFGLLFSVIGDSFLIWKETFPHGMVAFGIGHLFYISALGWRPLKLKLGIGLFISGLLFLATLQGLPTIMKIFFPLYTLLLSTMVWRALARVKSMDRRSLIDITTSIGALLFLISDSVIGLHMFMFRVPYHQVLIMGTYYTAQFLIALSVIRDNGRKQRE